MSTIPFRAALFDLDGTLLDSLYVWKRVDEVFFARRGMEVPPDYNLAIAGMSYRETAQYTVAHYVPGEEWQDVVDEWKELSQIEYDRYVQLKPGSLEYLRMLKREGVKLAVTTAMPPEQFTPCLERLNVLDLFDVLCSTEHTGGRGKATGEVYLLAAQQLGVQPQDCAVFEDVLAGIVGAKQAGMRAFCIRDPHAKKDFGRMEEIADGMLDSISEMRNFHAFPESRRCVIFTAHCEGARNKVYAAQANDYVLCADGGWKIAAQMGVKPDLVIGDFDSAEAPQVGNVEKHPVMKDDTDTMLCVKRAIRMGFDEIQIIGGFGGRFDHTFANLQTMKYAVDRDVRISMIDGNCMATMLRNGSTRIPRRKGKLSLFAFDEKVRGITAKGVLYPLEDGELTNSFPLGTSNEFMADAAEISVKEGALLIIQTDD